MSAKIKLVQDKSGTIEVNNDGGKQSHIRVRFDLLDAEAMRRLARVLYEGAARYTPNNWRKIDRASHMNHAMLHLTNALEAGPSTEEELDHAFCRLMMAVATK